MSGSLHENVNSRTQTPSHWRSEFTHEATGLTVTQTKFIIDANVAVGRGSWGRWLVVGRV